MKKFTEPVNVLSTRLSRLAGRRRERGAFSVMSAPLLLLMIVLCGLALDMGQLYNRNVDLSGFANEVALAAARELNGTSSGITSARAKARMTAESLRYNYFSNGVPFTWSDSALTFSKNSSRSGDWVDGTVPTDLYFAKVDTSALDPTIGNVNTFLMGFFSNASRTIHLNNVAVAGRAGINVTPIAICAMSSAAAAQRTNPGLSTTELVEYGFRRGISYDLMQLNPNGTSPVAYLINPVSAPGSTSSTFDTSLIGPFVCTGNMWVSHLSGGSIQVSPLAFPSPLTNLYPQLNSRFDDFTGSLCNPYGAPPDFNVKAYAYDKAGAASWMNPGTGSPAATTTTSRGKLETIADLPSPPSGTTGSSYGPLWSYAKAVKYSSYSSSGTPEPSSGYATFAASDWTNLYKLGPSATGYPAGTPYQASTGSTYKAPGSANLELSTLQRRVLNIPLLNCPVSAGANVSASVLGIGKFFMTVPATKNALVAEFAGVLSEQNLSGEVVLFP